MPMLQLPELPVFPVLQVASCQFKAAAASVENCLMTNGSRMGMSMGWGGKRLEWSGNIYI